MKILLVHNWYGSTVPSGENVVVEAEAELLRNNGVDVVEYFTHSDGIRGKGWFGKIIGGLATPFNPFTYYRIRRLLRRERPDVVHVHNFFPLVSPAVFYAASHEKAPVVMTLHNYRLGCGRGIPFRNEAICMQCLENKSVLPLLRYRCYRGSLVASIPMAVMISLHRWLGTWQQKIDLFITLTSFQAKIMDEVGLVPIAMSRMKPQFMKNPPDVIPFNMRDKRVIFIGRVSKEKGLPVLLEAWRIWGGDAPQLVIVGDGPDLPELRERFAEINVRWLGKLKPLEAIEKLGKSQLLVFPSICYEGFPMVVREALACGVPILSSDIGPMSELIQPAFGQLFIAGNSANLLMHANAMLANPSESLKGKAVAARLEFDQKYTEERNFALLIDIYREVIKPHTDIPHTKPR
jgi:glycosyltransferase involved in cell wall biosynthesis